MSSTPLAAILIGYLVFLFLVAAVAERFGRRLANPRLQTLTYVLAVSVYCTAWTFYGSVGLAANRGLEFLTIYLGPALVALVWPTVLRKLVRVAKEQRITTISDFIASRYGKSAPLGTLVAALVVCGMIPYIALQLKAVSVSFAMMIGGDSVLVRLRPRASGGGHARPLRHPVRRAQSRLHPGADRARCRRWPWSPSSSWWPSWSWAGS